MFLRGPRELLACLALGSVLLSAGRAHADAKQCVLHNNNGAQLRDEHRLLAARGAYRACLAEPACPEIVRSECDAALADIKSAIPTLIVAVLDERGHDLPGAALLLDGKPVALDGSTIEVDPGPHRLQASKGTRRSELELMAIESDVSRRVQLVLEAPREKVVSVAPAARPTWPMYALGGVAAVGAASFGYFALSGHSDVNRLDQCKPTCNPDDVERARTKYLVADVSLGVSLVALAGAGYWFFTRPKAEAPPARESAFSFAVSARPDAAGINLRWVE